MAKKSRLDNLLVTREFFTSREQAQRAIMAGEVRIGTRVATKASILVTPDAVITVESRSPYVGRGGEKLAAALDAFNVAVEGKIALDIGASTGGFTDCLLHRGAARVYAVDVGHDQLAWRIRKDPRVIVFENLNARSLSRTHIPEPIDLCVIDVSFISLTLILPNAFELITPDGVIIALIKPQFELERADVGRGGIVREPELHEKAKAKIAGFVRQAGHHVIAIAPSVITGRDGNQEFFACLRKKSD
jgi:23S rRNA (cytidine1920-2'-O)/16S rRNA (cytidine1409-2'-O)-methyltransferase